MPEPDTAADWLTEFGRARWVWVIVGFLCMVAVRMGDRRLGQ
jgi:hypothetical protein